MPKVFPIAVSLASRDAQARVTLHADGTCTGDPALMERWLATLDSREEPPHYGTMAAVVLWMLLRKLQDDQRVARPPRTQGLGG